MAIPSDTCALCCTCPTATVEWDSVSASLTKCGSSEFGTPSSPPKYYLSSTANGVAGNIPASTWSNAKSTYNSTCTGLTLTGDVISSYSETCDYSISGVIFRPQEWDVDTCSGATRTRYLQDVLKNCPNRVESTYVFVYSNTSSTVRIWRTCGTTNDVTETLSDEYTTATLKSNTVAALPAYDNDWNDTAGSFANLSTNELTYSIRESRYRLRFKIPTVGTALNFRATWVERFIAEAGVSISSVSVNKSGVYRPTITLSAPPSGGTQAYAVAVMSSTGTVSSISILNIGSGYTSAPTVTIQTASGGGTTSTGWTATLTAGSVTAIAGGTAGNYRPTLAFSGGGGLSATATCTVNAQGGIDVVTMTASGSAYTSEPTLTITPKVSGSTAADLLIHLGTETSKCTVWDGATPGGYDAATSSTWPILPSAAPNYYSLAVPGTDGTTLVANVRTFCNGSTC